ncbi:MAG: ATP-binding protein [Actinobacteria bacterium]|nr:ATP-binding protein [Actinomycetota bacterium]
MSVQVEEPGFVGREDDLARLERLLDDDAPAPVAFLHGPGGIGKSSLLRELGRRAEARGLTVRAVDGRDTDAAPAALAAALAALRQGRCAVLLLDTYEQATALGVELREGIDAAPPGARIVVAGRRPPDGAWLGEKRAGRVLVRSLAPLGSADARQLLLERGLADDAAVTRIVAWAAGSPLALSVAADTLLAGNEVDLDQLDADQLLAHTLVSHLARDELDDADHDIVAVAAIARAVDPQLLAAALPGVDGDHAEAWLRTLSFAETLGTRVTLHERVRRAVRAALAAEDPEHERALRRRIVDHLHARAELGELRLIVDLAELIDNPQVRWGIAPPPVGVRADRFRAGDRERLAQLLGGVEGAGWWPGVVRWLEQAPEHVIAIRDEAGLLVGWRIWATPASAPEWVEEDAILGPWLADARRRAPDGEVLLLRDGKDLIRERDAEPTSPIVSAANYASVLGSGLRSVRYVYATTDPADRQIHEFLLAMGYERRLDLDVADGGRTVPSYVVDWGPGGVVRFIRDLVYYDLGMTPPPASPTGALAADSVRDGLRSFHDPIALAANPLARGRRADQRASSVRQSILTAVAEAFGDTPDERLQRAAIERGYLDPDGGHVIAMQELNFSRSTYFRRLAAASDRVAEHVLSARTG